MDEVEYCLIRKNGRLSADEIKKLEKGTIAPKVRTAYMYMYDDSCLSEHLFVWL